MTASKPKKPFHLISKGKRLERLRKAKRLLEGGRSRSSICKEMGLAKATLQKYIEDFYLLSEDETENKRKEKPVKARTCLHCRAKFIPKSRYYFLCINCNNFAREAMV